MSLDLVDSGTLTRPGPIGRTLRLALGIICLFGFWETMSVAFYFIAEPVQRLPTLALLIVFPLCIFNYVVNIGFSKDWQRYPLFASLGLFAVLALAGFVITGDPGTTVLGIALIVWLAYFYAHLGVSFLFTALLATPGCEMRSISELIGRVYKEPVQEHHCPVSIISDLDSWEQRLWKNER